jgi:membrane-associated phospholipid phosphatase
MMLVVYLLGAVVPLAKWSFETHAVAPLLAHLLVCALTATAWHGKVGNTIRSWTPLAAGPFLYISGARFPHHDQLVSNWEFLLFPSSPTRSLALMLPFRGLSELLHIAYISYYFLVYVPPALLWFRGRRRQFGDTVLPLTIAYAACFVTFVLFPVDGPRFLYGPAPAPDGPVRRFVIALLASGSSRGTAFPSSHVAASVVASVCALRFQRPVGIVVALLTAGICIGAVYGGYHYAVDIVAGLLTGAVALIVAYAIETRAHRVGLP